MTRTAKPRRTLGDLLRQAVLLGSLAVVIVLSAACAKGEEAEKKALDKPPPMTVEEITRGRDACGAYVARLCKCADADAKFADDCHMKKAKISALEMLVVMDKTDQSTAAELWKSQETARKIIAACIQENNALDTQGCAR